MSSTNPCYCPQCVADSLAQSALNKAKGYVHSVAYVWIEGWGSVIVCPFAQRGCSQIVHVHDIEEHGNRDGNREHTGDEVAPFYHPGYYLVEAEADDAQRIRHIFDVWRHDKSDAYYLAYEFNEYLLRAEEA